MRLFILFSVFVVIFIVQQSHLFVSEKTIKSGSITVEENHMRWDNVSLYFKKIRLQIDRTIHPRWRR